MPKTHFILDILCIKAIIPFATKKIVAKFLDILHSLPVELDLSSLILLVQFLRDEGKSGEKKKQWDVIIILVLYFPDESEFETALLEILKGELEQADLALDTRLIITYLCNKFDGFDGVMEKVNFVVFWLRKNSYLNL